MAKFMEFNEAVSLHEQMESAEKGPIILINSFTVDPDEEEALITAWAHDAEFMKAQPGYISTQLHKAIGGSTSFVNYAVWESVEDFRSAFTNPEFQKRIADYPQSAIASPHLFKRLAVQGYCVA